jgi:mono/diheme cytochrome c family protein
MFKMIIGALLAAAVVAGGVWYYFTSGRAPVAVADPPLPLEKRLSKAALHARLSEQKSLNPLVPADEANFLAGAEVYKKNCAVCHGLPGQTPTPIALGMYPKPPLLFRGKGVTDDPAWESYWKATNGIRLTGMPAFKGRLSETQLWQVSQLLANADTISPAVKGALTAPAELPPVAPATPAAGVAGRGKKREQATKKRRS